MGIKKNVVADEVQEMSKTITMVKFCPICGDKMHKETMYGNLWWVCDDPDCAFIQLIE